MNYSELCVTNLNFQNYTFGPRTTATAGHCTGWSVWTLSFTPHLTCCIGSAQINFSKPSGFFTYHQA